MENEAVLVPIDKEDWKEILRIHNEAHNYVITRNLLDRMVTKVLKDDKKDLMDEGDCITLVYSLTSLLVNNEAQNREAAQITEIVADTPEELHQKLTEFFGDTATVLPIEEVQNSEDSQGFFYDFMALLPSWVNYIAMDESGELWVFENMPTATVDGTWDVPNGEFDILSGLLNWKATLTKVNK